MRHKLTALELLEPRDDGADHAFRLFVHNRQHIELEPLMERLQAIAGGLQPDRAIDHDEACYISSAIALCVQLHASWLRDYQARQAVSLSGVKYHKSKPTNNDYVTLDPDRSTATLLALGHWLNELVEALPEGLRGEFDDVVTNATACLHAVGSESICTMRRVAPEPSPIAAATAITDAVAACALASQITGLTIRLERVEGEQMFVEGGGLTVNFPVSEVVNNDTVAVTMQLAQEFSPELHDSAKLDEAFRNVMPTVNGQQMQHGDTAQLRGKAEGEGWAN